MKISRERLQEMTHDELVEFAEEVGLASHGDATQVLTRIVTSSREFSDL